MCVCVCVMYICMYLLRICVPGQKFLQRIFEVYMKYMHIYEYIYMNIYTYPHKYIRNIYEVYIKEYNCCLKSVDLKLQEMMLDCLPLPLSTFHSFVYGILRTDLQCPLSLSSFKGIRNHSNLLWPEPQHDTKLKLALTVGWYAFGPGQASFYFCWVCPLLEYAVLPLPYIKVLCSTCMGLQLVKYVLIWECLSGLWVVALSTLLD